MGRSLVRQNISSNAGRRGKIVHVDASEAHDRLLSIFVRSQSIAADFNLSEDQIPLGCVYFFVVWGSDAYLKGMKAQSNETCRSYVEVLASASESKKSK